jgi:hypothetical protein
MYVRHFIKMFLWLIVMAGIGIGGLVLANHYSKTSATTAGTALPIKK